MTAMTLESESSKPCWFTPERRTWMAFAIGVGLIGFGIGNGHTTQNSVAHISAQLGDQKKVSAKLADVAGCQTARANIAKGEVVQSENGNDVNISAIPNCASVAKVLPKK